MYVVFFLCGLWHGASLNFVIWGLFHGTFLMFEKILNYFHINFYKKPFIGNFYSLIVVMIGWVFFRAQDLDSSLLYLEKMFSFSFFNEVSLYHVSSTSFLFPLLVGSILSFSFLMNVIKKNVLLESIIALLLMIISSLVLVQESLNPFIYFRF